MDVVPMPSPNSEIKVEKDFNIISDKNNTFNINIANFFNYIQIKACLKTNNNNLNKDYEKIYYLNELKNNKFLAICDSIDEVFDQLIYELEKDSKKVIKEGNNQITIIIPVEHLKIKEIIFDLPEKIKTDKQLIQDLFSEIQNLKMENNNLKEEIINLKNDISVLKTENKKINYLEDKIATIIKKLDCSEKKSNNEAIYDLNKSSILNNDINKQTAIISWIKEKTNSNLIKFELIFKMSENGSNSENFHKLCDNKGPTLIIIKTTKNKKFGGFTPLNWDSNGREKYDNLNQTFIFSLDLMKKYNMISINNEAIICRKDGPIFGCDDFMVYNDLTKGKTYANGLCNFLSNNNLELTGGNGNDECFEIEELEVYKVIFKK